MRTNRALVTEGVSTFLLSIVIYKQGSFGIHPMGRVEVGTCRLFLQLALLVLVQELVDLGRSINMLKVVNIVLALGPTNIGRHQAAIGVEGKLVPLREAFAQRATSINSQVDSVDVSGSG